jgi:hypothetical protein
MKRGSAGTKEILKKSRQILLRETRRAKRKWQLEFAQKCQRKNFQTNPKEAWRMVFQLRDGFQKHHRKPSLKRFKNKGGKLVTNPKENRKNIESHWKTVFNRHAT